MVIKTNYKKLILLLAVSFEFLFMGCPSPCIEARYTFSYTASIYPKTDTLYVGDTLFIQSTIPTQLQEHQSGKTIDYNNAIISSTLGLGELIKGDTVAKEAWNNFKYQIYEGKFYKDNSIPSPEIFMQIEFEKQNEYYKLKIGLIPQKKGIYILSLGNGMSQGNKNKKNCDKATFKASISNTNHHEYYYINWRNDSNFNQNEITRLYCFVVK